MTTCRECSGVFKSYAYNNNHRKLCTGVPPDVQAARKVRSEPLTCRHCRFEYKSQKGARTHMRECDHNPGVLPVECPDCHREYAIKESLRMHKPTYNAQCMGKCPHYSHDGFIAPALIKKHLFHECTQLPATLLACFSLRNVL